MKTLPPKLTLTTRPQTRPAGRTGAERQAIRDREKRRLLGPVPPTKETRQNWRAALRKARKEVAAGK